MTLWIFKLSQVEVNERTWLNFGWIPGHSFETFYTTVLPRSHVSQGAESILAERTKFKCKKCLNSVEYTMAFLVTLF